MKPNQTFLPSRDRAFTLIELLVVIAVIAILAALIFPAGAAIKKGATIKKAQAELLQVETAINSYKAKYGHFPPDNPTNQMLNTLYFELVGTTLKGTDFVTLDGAATYNPGTFGLGIVNCTKGAGDEGAPAVKFLTELKPGQYGETSVGSGVRLLTCSVSWPNNLAYPLASNPGLNPWHYVSSAATNNPGSYDLWTEVLISGKTNIISNWSKQPQIR